MWHQSHKWIMEPYTAYEIRRELRVRESKHTCMLFDRKYYDVEAGKYCFDKLPTIQSLSWSDVYVDNDNHTEEYFNRPGWATGKNVYIERQKMEEENQKWFTPKDNDFDEECRRDEENKKLQQQEIRRQEMQVMRLKQELKEMEEARSKRLSDTNHQYVITWSGKRRIG